MGRGMLLLLGPDGDWVLCTRDLLSILPSSRHCKLNLASLFLQCLGELKLQMPSPIAVAYNGGNILQEFNADRF